MEKNQLRVLIEDIPVIIHVHQTTPRLRGVDHPLLRLMTSMSQEFDEGTRGPVSSCLTVLGSWNHVQARRARPVSWLMQPEFQVSGCKLSSGAREPDGASSQQGSQAPRGSLP